MRKFIVTYPRFGDFNIIPPSGQFLDFSQIAVDQFQSAAEISQLSLQMTGNDIIRTTADPVWKMSILGESAIMRQANFMLQLLQQSGTNGERADTNEFLVDFIHWLDGQNIKRLVPMFGNDPHSERTWASGGGFLAEWEGQPPASVYAVQLHKLYVIYYELEDE